VQEARGFSVCGRFYTLNHHYKARNTTSHFGLIAVLVNQMVTNILRISTVVLILIEGLFLVVCGVFAMKFVFCPCTVHASHLDCHSGV